MNKQSKVICKHIALATIVLMPVIADAKPGKLNPTPVIVEEVTSKTYRDEVEALGTLRANESVEITATVSELVTSVKFTDGQRVKKGHVIVELDAREESAQLAEELSHLEEAIRQAKRIEPLAEEGATSEARVDTQRREVETSKARIEAIKTRIDLREVKAPFDGVLGLRNISVGALVQPGTLITTLDDDSVMKLDFTLPATYLPLLTPGTEAVATSSAYPQSQFIGKIKSIGSRVDPITRSVVVRAIIDNPEKKLKPGLLMRVLIKQQPRSATFIPEKALIPDSDSSYVYIQKKEGEIYTVERRKVEQGTRRTGEVEIISGINEGEYVVTHGTLRVRPGQPIKILSASSIEELTANQNVEKE